nr:immunoglobulin light chain junction region [Macaca mulatta]MOW65060.1 immunoglobulin light chain junction region [Macaca mulatta]MOW65246.1 immunoglobulin light chain junction region [Macaca mulatta]MOW65419.1 immunoglobulin light chain junction region [Macaca mulatta]MOW65585.1 immunoglobulin light chain junction region [Macaca mulatta]
CQHSYDIPYTF